LKVSSKNLPFGRAAAGIREVKVDSRFSAYQNLEVLFDGAPDLAHPTVTVDDITAAAPSFITRHHRSAFCTAVSPENAI
jgi:hypothetical protein